MGEADERSETEEDVSLVYQTRTACRKSLLVEANFPVRLFLSSNGVMQDGSGLLGFAPRSR